MPGGQIDVLLGLSYWFSMMALGISLSRDCARPRFESGESWAASVGVRMTSAPRPFMMFSFSMLTVGSWVSGGDQSSAEGAYSSRAAKGPRIQPEVLFESWKQEQLTIVIMQRYPLTAATKASAIPVFPEAKREAASRRPERQLTGEASKARVEYLQGSTSTLLPGMSLPSFSASSTILRAILSCRRDERTVRQLREPPHMPLLSCRAVGQSEQ